MPFDLTTNGLSFDNARYCEQACAAVYAENRAWKVTDCGSYIRVDWEGTKTTQQMLDDLKFWKVPLPGHPGIKVESGFLCEWLMHGPHVEDAIAAIEATKTKSVPLVIDGHSLGGALAHIHAALSQWPVHAIYTFGKPRVWNLAGARAFNKTFKGRVFDFVAQLDIVPRAPLTLRLDGTEILMRGRGRYVVDPSLCRRLTLDIYWLARGWAKRHFKVFGDPLKDHHLATSYQPLLEKLK